MWWIERWETTVAFKVFPKHLPKPLFENATQTSLIKVLLLKEVWISRFKVQNVIYWSYDIDNLNFMKKSNKNSWQTDQACLLINQGRSKRMDIEGQAPTRILCIQFHHHLSINNERLAAYSRYCTSHVLLPI